MTREHTFVFDSNTAIRTSAAGRPRRAYGRREFSRLHQHGGGKDYLGLTASSTPSPHSKSTQLLTFLMMMGVFSPTHAPAMLKE